MNKFKAIAVCALAVPLVTGCVTNKRFKQAMAQQTAALETERSARVATDSALSGDVATLRTDLEALRGDLQNLRTEFGAKITAMEEGLMFVFPVNFVFDDATVRAEDIPALDRFAQVVQRHYNGSKVTVEGFADPAGSASYNRALSQRRADAVRSHLVTQGFTEDILQAVGYGETRQVVQGAERDEPGAEKNRRVVFVVESRGDPTVAAAVLSTMQ